MNLRNLPTVLRLGQRISAANTEREAQAPHSPVLLSPPLPPLDTEVEYMKHHLKQSHDFVTNTLLSFTTSRRNTDDAITQRNVNLFNGKKHDRV